MKAKLFPYLILTLFLVTSSWAATSPQWQKLEACTLLPNKYNDGDSFHVMHNGTEYLFRLYFVDCPESDQRFPERVQDQAAYFNTVPEKALELARLAKEYTAHQLHSPFTIITCWQKALGSSKLQRYYALVLTKNGYLDRLLIQQGLARVYGKRITLPDGMLSKDYRLLLSNLEIQAKSAGNGGWNPNLQTTPAQ